MWYSEHKDPSLELTCRPPGTQYGLSSKLKSRGGARVRVDPEERGRRGLGQMSARPTQTSGLSGGDQARTANVMDKECGGGWDESSLCPFPQRRLCLLPSWNPPARRAGVRKKAGFATPGAGRWRIVES